MNRLATIIIAVLVVTGLSGVANAMGNHPLASDNMEKWRSYVESVEVSFDAIPTHTFKLGTAKGSIRLNTWDRNHIKVVVTKTTKAPSLSVAQRILDGFSIQARSQAGTLALRGKGDHKDVGITYTIWVPENYAVDVRTKEGSIDLASLSAKFSAHTENGKITIEGEDAESLDVQVDDDQADSIPNTNSGSAQEELRP